MKPSPGMIMFAVVGCIAFAAAGFIWYELPVHVGAFRTEAMERAAGLPQGEVLLIQHQLVADTKGKFGDEATLFALDGEYYDFAMGSSNDDGGIELIAKKSPGGSFSVIWAGQDAPHCNQVSEVPKSIVEHCF